VKFLQFLTLLLIFSFSPAYSQEKIPKLSKERAVLHTIAGDIVLAFYPDEAPQTVAQIEKLIKMGVYDGTHFPRLENDFVAQISNAEDRRVPLTAEQTKAIHPLKAEFNSIKHKRGILSMAREDNDINSADTSFSILLNDAPHLDGQYTVFGEVVSGMDVVDEFFKVAHPKSSPIVRIEIQKAVMVPNLKALEKMEIIPAHNIFFDPPAESLTDQVNIFRNLDFALYMHFFLILSTLGIFLLIAKLSTRTIRALLMTNIFVGAFCLLVGLSPFARKDTILGVFLFFGILTLLRFMGLFEAHEKK
jgi:cyclophilin family peptidyl-prolyl cis-trans isomerase